MRLGLVSTVLTIGLLAAPGLAQNNPVAINRLNVQQAGPMDRERRDFREYRRYDFDRIEPGQRRYFANRYYRDGRYYGLRTMGGGDRLYRGSDDRYYCRRPDGTTGRIEGGLRSGTFGPTIGRGDSAPLGTLIAANRPALAAELGRGGIRCR